MVTLQVIKSGFSTVWKGIRGKCTRIKGASETSLPEVIVGNKNITVPKDEFVRTTPKPPRSITVADKYNFRQYLLGKKLDLKVTPQEIKELFAHEGEEFKVKSLEFLCKKMKVPQELKPDFIYAVEVQAPMYYDFVMNTIKVNPNFAEQLADKTTFLATLRHEMQHYAQNMAMFRHETKGEELINLYSKLGAKSVHTNVDKYVKTLDIEQLKQIFDEEGMRDIIRLKDLLKNNKMEEYEKYLTEIEERMYQRYVPLFTDFRKNIIDQMGIIKKETVEGKRAARMIDETSSELTYWKKDGSIDVSKYFGDMREAEALTAQDMMALRLNAITSGNDKYCYIKQLRESQENAQKNIDKLDPSLQELVKKSQGTKVDDEKVKQVIAYLYD